MSEQKNHTHTQNTNLINELSVCLYIDSILNVFKQVTSEWIRNSNWFKLKLKLIDRSNAMKS